MRLGWGRERGQEWEEGGGEEVRGKGKQEGGRGGGEGVEERGGEGQVGRGRNYGEEGGKRKTRRKEVGAAERKGIVEEGVTARGDSLWGERRK